MTLPIALVVSVLLLCLTRIASKALDAKEARRKEVARDALAQLESRWDAHQANQEKMLVLVQDAAQRLALLEVEKAGLRAADAQDRLRVVDQKVDAFSAGSGRRLDEHDALIVTLRSELNDLRASLAHKRM